MITNNEAVSRVINNMKGISKDARIPRRFVLSILNTKARFLMAQKLDEMTLFREDGIISNIKCFEMEEISSKTCGCFEFALCNRLMKSKEKLPEPIFGKNGPSIISVSSIDGSQSFDYISIRRYYKNKKRKYSRGNVRYYSIEDGYLFLPNSEVEALDIAIITTKKSEVEKVSSCCENKSVCKTQWDYEFVCPDRFLDLVIKDTLQEVASIYRSSVADENPNLDINQKTQTIQ